MHAIERELRFYFPIESLDSWRQKLSKADYLGRYHEMTVMYDNPNPELSFYNEKIDGRLRLRYSSPDKDNPSMYRKGKGLVTWKQRLPESFSGSIRREKEIEYHFNPNDGDKVRAIFEDVLRCQKISSYERFRSYFKHNLIQITVDEFPFGLMVEFELDNQASDDDAHDIVNSYGVDHLESSILSCDDKYHELCKLHDRKAKPDILFSDKDMPMIS